jgi:hypothetical protein
MDHDHVNQGRSGDEPKRDHQLRHELDQATPSLGLFGLIVGVLLLIAVGVFFFAPPVGDNASVASRDTVEAPAPSTPPGNQ